MICREVWGKINLILYMYYMYVYNIKKQVPGGKAIPERQICWTGRYGFNTAEGYLPVRTPPPAGTITRWRADLHQPVMPGGATKLCLFPGGETTQINYIF